MPCRASRRRPGRRTALRRRLAVRLRGIYRCRPLNPPRMPTVPPKSKTNPSLAKPAVPSAAADRMIEALRRAIPLLPEDMRDDVAALLSPTNIAVTTGVFALWGASHAVGVGELADAVLLALGIITLGSMAFEVAGSIGQFVS